MYYIVSKNPNMIRASVHLGTHDHLVADRECRKAMDLIRDQIMSQVARSLNAKSSAIGMAVEKELLLKGPLDEDANDWKLKESELAQVFDK
jgi:hypothetical protein